MPEISAVVAAAIPVVTLLEKLRRLLARPRRDPAPAVDDGVSVVGFETAPVVHPTAEAIRKRKRHAGASLAVLAVAVVVTSVMFSPLVTALVAGELVLLLPGFIAARRRRDDPDEPAHCFEVELRVSGPVDGVVARLRRGFDELGALSVIGTTMRIDDRHVFIDGGTGSWGVNGDAGYRVRATVSRTDEVCHITVTGMNYVPAMLQWLHNRRNVAGIVRHLLA